MIVYFLLCDIVFFFQMHIFKCSEETFAIDCFSSIWLGFCNKPIIYIQEGRIYFPQILVLLHWHFDIITAVFTSWMFNKLQWVFEVLYVPSYCRKSFLVRYTIASHRKLPECPIHSFQFYGNLERSVAV